MKTYKPTVVKVMGRRLFVSSETTKKEIEEINRILVSGISFIRKIADAKNLQSVIDKQKTI